MRVLLTGAAGFIGSHVARELVARDHDVVALVRPGHPAPRLMPVADRIETVVADLERPGDAAVVKDVAPQACIHLAWYVEPGRYLHAVSENLASLEASVRLLRALADHGCSRIVVGSSAFEALTGGLPGRVTPPQRSIYATAKAALHEVVCRLGEEGLAAACAHIFYLYGPGEHPKRLVPLLIRSLLRGEPIDVTDGRQERDYLHVADVAAALCMIAEAGATGSVDICSPEPIRVAAIYDAIGGAMGRRELIHDGARPYGEGEVLRAAGDDSAIRSVGWTPHVPLDEGIAACVAWWRDRLEGDGEGASGG